jgi:hypothetical protein
MSFIVTLCVGLSVLAADVTGAAKPVAPHASKPGVAAQPRVIEGVRQPQTVVDVNRPRSPFDCALPMGDSWYGSRERCLAYLCGGENVYNEYIFDADNRRRKNPCYGQSPTEFPGD